MIVSLSLVLGAVIKFEHARKAPGRPLDSVPQPTPITDYPCRVFTGIASMNLGLSITIFSLSCISSKVRKTDNVINDIFAILSAIGFVSSMGACFFLSKRNALQVDLWQWACDNHRNAVSSSALDFKLICEVVDYGWKFGLVQASLELLTFIVSIAAFCILKYSLFARFGAVGKIF
ncbi:uncharacterized protein BP5553_02038 [Venustampulla echinocandica]|uniref:MARVEL domain-containing protein n=1 Tax=Venustampulla echinocandica TaxID=2656787 RepID=A0A370U2Q6_9HELO|nr:uncharacterized protein BP5553_02038 [Venustampulla echinocandica]RDL42059.1 hypothetical protein BP5553_02038 [Venustampulla echinocandica]